MSNFKKSFIGVLTALVVVLSVGCNAPAEETSVPPASAPQEIYSPLMDQYPAFFNLDTTNGLTVFVTMFAPESYSCALYPTGTMTTDSAELAISNRVDLPTMKEILACYNLSPEAITVVPYQSLLSSYIAPELFADNAEVQLRYKLGLGEKPEEEAVEPEDTGDTPFAYTVNWADATEAGEHALRYTYYPITGTYAYQNELTYPAVGIKNTDELDGFLSLAKNYFSLDASIPNKETFNVTVKKFDETFFQENGIVIVYIPSESISIRYSLTDATLSGEELHVCVAEKRPEGELSQQPAGWFMVVELPREIISQANYFSAG